MKFYHSFHHKNSPQSNRNAYDKKIHKKKLVKTYSPKIFIRLEAFAATEFNKIFSGR